MPHYYMSYLPLKRNDVSYPKGEHTLTESQGTQDGPNGWAPGWISSAFALTIFHKLDSLITTVYNIFKSIYYPLIGRNIFTICLKYS